MTIPNEFSGNYNFIVPDWQQIREYLLKYETEGVDIFNEILFDAGCEDDFKDFINALFTNIGTNSAKENILKAHSKIEEQIGTLASRINTPHFEKEGNKIKAGCKSLQKKLEELFKQISELI